MITPRLGDRDRYPILHMRFTLSTLLLLVAISAVPFGVHSVKTTIWKRHCRSLEPSLIRHVILRYLRPTDIQNDESSELTGYSGQQISLHYLWVSRPESDDFAPISVSMLEQIGISWIKRSDSDNDIPKCFVKIVKWIDRETVELDFRTTNGPDATKQKCMIIRHSNGKWRVLDFWSS